MLLPPICSTCPKFQKVYPGRCFPLSFVQNHHAARGRVPCHMSHVPPPLLLFAVNASPRSVSDGSSLLNRSTYPPSSSTPSSPFLFLLPRLKSQYGSFPTSFDPELLNAPRRICDPVSASSRSLSGRIQLMNAYGTIVIVAVRTRHPASTLGRENAEEGGGGGGGGPADDDGVGGLCFPKCRRSSRATWGGILLAIWGVGRHSLRARERERGDGMGRKMKSLVKVSFVRCGENRIVCSELEPSEIVRPAIFRSQKIIATHSLVESSLTWQGSRMLASFDLRICCWLVL